MTRAFDPERELRQHGAALRTLALALLGDSHAADDAVQETWLRALEQPPGSASSPGGWLATVLRRLASRARRGELRRRRREAESARVDNLPAADVQAVREEMLLAVVDAVLSLEAPYRDVIWQRYLEERTPAAIARTSGEPIATVKSRLQRGLAQLRQRLDERRGGSDWRAGLAAAFHLAAVPAVLTTGAVVMGTTAKVAGAAAIVAAVSLWWVLAQQDSTAAPLLPGATSPTATALAAVPEPAAPERANEQDALAAGDHQRQLAPEPDLGPTANLRVVRYGTNAPIADATVHYRTDLDWSHLPANVQEELQQLSASDTEALMQRLGRQRSTDADGWCRVPIGKHGAHVCARAGDLYGEHWVALDSKTPHVLTLRTDRTLAVRVLDASGAPADGVPMQIQREAATRNGVTTFGLAATDSDGRCVKRHVQLFAGDEPTCLAEIVAVPPGIRAAARVDLVAPTPEIVLHLPACGSVTVHVRDAEGKPIDPTFLAEPDVQLAAVESEPDQQELHRVLSRTGKSAPLAGNGDALFPRVGFDRRLVVCVQYWFSAICVEGPTRARPHVEVTLHESPGGVTFVGTLLDEEGRLFADREFVLSYRSEDLGSSGSYPGRTDARGRLRCKMNHVEGGATYALILGTPPNQREGRLAVELPPRTVQAGIHDLGEVRLAALPLLVAGSLVPEPGVDIVNVQLFVERRRGDQWAQEINLHPDWGEGGRFSFHSSTPAGVPLRLLVREGSFLPVEPIECTSGDKTIEIPLRAAGEARADFLADAEVPLDQLRFHFRRTDASTSTSEMQQDVERIRSRGAALDPDGRMRRRWAGLATGVYELSVQCPGAAEPVVRVQDIHVSGGPCTDTRLQGIDLRGRVRRIEIRAADAAGTQIRDDRAFAIVRESSGDPRARWTGRNFATGVVVVAAAPTVDVWVLARGFEMAAADAVAESRVIALRPAAVAQLRVELPAPLPADKSMRLQLTPTLGMPSTAFIELDTGRGMLVEDFLIEDVKVAADGTAGVPVRWSGKYTVMAWLVDGSGSGGDHAVYDIAPRTITLPAGGTLTLRVGARGLQQALQMQAR